MKKLFFLFTFNIFAQVLPGKEINRICKESIEGLISEGRIVVEERRIPDMVLPDGSLTLETEPSISFQNAIVNIKIFLDGKEYKSIRKSFRIKKFKDVVVCLKEIGRGEMITQEMVNIEEREITHISGYITRIEDVIGREAKRKIQEGNIILLRDIKEIPLVNFGDIVTIIKNGPGFSIKAKGMVISTGYKGKEVLIRNLSSQRIIKGIVIDKGIVEVR